MFKSYYTIITADTKEKLYIVPAKGDFLQAKANRKKDNILKFSDETSANILLRHICYKYGKDPKHYKVIKE